MIHLSHIYKVYQNSRHALRDLSFEIEKGEFVFLTGASGAGKTTLFRMISAFDRVTSGEIHVAGFDLNKIEKTELNQFRRKIGVVFQDYRLLNDRSIFDNVALPLLIKNERPHILRRKVEEVLRQVGLFEKAEDLPMHLSGGEQQRTAIARAIVHQPPVLIADEPTGNLDPALAEEIMDLFEKVSAQGTTVLIATHDMGLVQRRKKRTLHLQAGHLVNSEKPSLEKKIDYGNLGSQKIQKGSMISRERIEEESNQEVAEDQWSHHSQFSKPETSFE